MSFLIDYKTFEDDVYIPKDNQDFKKKYNDSKKKIKVNIFSRGLKYLSLVGSENLRNRGIGFTCKMKKKLLHSIGSCTNNDDFQKVYPGISCTYDDIRKPKYIEYVWNNKHQ